MRFLFARNSVNECNRDSVCITPPRECIDGVRERRGDKGSGGRRSIERDVRRACADERRAGSGASGGRDVHVLFFIV